MANQVLRNVAVLVKIETTSGTAESSLSASTDAVAIADVTLSPNPTVDEANELTSGLDTGEREIGGMTMGLSFAVPIKGASAAGTTPEWVNLAKVCGWDPTTLTVLPSSSSFTVASGTSRTIVIDRSAGTGTQLSANNDSYLGHAIELSGNPSTPVVSTIVAYSVSGNNVTITVADTFSPVLSSSTTAKILPQVVFKPISTGLPTATVWLYRDGRLWKFYGAAGDLSIAMQSGRRANFNVNLTSLFGSLTDASLVDPTLSTIRPPVWKGSSGGAALLGGLPIACSSLSLGFGNQVVAPDDPNALEGFQTPGITGRDLTGSVDPLATLVATRATFADFRGNTPRDLVARWGSVAGNRMHLTVPRAKYTQVGEADRQGFVTDAVQFQASSGSGKNKGAFLALC